MIISLILGAVGGMKSVYRTVKKNMDSKKEASIAPLFSAIPPRLASRLVIIDLFLGSAGAAICGMVNGIVITDFLIGFFIGILNQYLYVSTAGRAVLFKPEKAGVFVMMMFYARFALSALVMALFAWKFSLNPWAILGGFGLTLLATILTMALILKEES